jgi:D-2-hydroxyacid dehydrogenase (NADP+)
LVATVSTTGFGEVSVEVMVFEDGSHLNVGALRREFPHLTIHATHDMAEALRICTNAEVLVALAHHVTDDLLAAMPKLRWIASLTTGTDHLRELGNLRNDVLVTSGRGIHGPQMSELALLNMIALSRRFPKMLRNQMEAKWERWPQPVLLEKTAVIVGVGQIGEALARRCRAFEMKLVAVSDARNEIPGFDLVFPRTKLKQAAALADFLIVLVPLNAETRHMINDEIISAMKPTAFLINLARGDVIDEAALIRHLSAGGIAGAGLDVFAEEPPRPDNPLWRMSNVVMTPRIGGMSDRYAEQVLPLMIHNLRAFADGRPQDMRNIV